MSTPDFLPTLTGSFSQPAAENPTVVMMEAAFRRHGLHYRYINMEVAPEDLADAVRGAKAQGFAGFNCSLPHKVAVIPHLDALGDSAKLIGAVNCAVKQPDGRWVGENTDGKGFLSSLEEVILPKDRQVVILGAGGAARAIAVELALAGVAKLILVNRNPQRGQELARHLQTHTSAEVTFQTWDGEYAVPEEADVLVNATSIGLYPHREQIPPLVLDSLFPGLVVADVIPNPPRTRLLREAEIRDCRVLDGLGMLVNQGAANIQYWTGVSPDKSVMRAALEDVFGVA